MHIVDEPLETVHLYVVREEPKRPYTFLPLLAACLCLAVIASVTVYSWQHPAYEDARLSIPVQFLPPLTFSATKQITPTGVKTYPATAAHGTLTISNGSVVSQELPQGLIFTSKVGDEVATDTSVFVPAGSAAGFGAVSVSAHTVMSGAKANLSPLSIDAVYGTSLYIRNLEPFTGGADSYSIKVITTQDRQTALESARSVLTSQIARIHDLPAHPCAEVVNSHESVVTVVMTCQFVTFTPPPGAEVLSARVVGSRVLVHVKMVMVNHPTAFPGK